MAAVIEMLFKRTGHNIKRQEIIDLFDDFARDTKETAVIDTDFQEAEETRDQAIYRVIKEIEKLEKKYGQPIQNNS